MDKKQAEESEDAKSHTDCKERERGRWKCTDREAESVQNAAPHGYPNTENVDCLQCVTASEKMEGRTCREECIHHCRFRDEVTILEHEMHGDENPREHEHDGRDRTAQKGRLQKVPIQKGSVQKVETQKTHFQKLTGF